MAPSAVMRLAGALAVCATAASAQSGASLQAAFADWATAHDTTGQLATATYDGAWHIAGAGAPAELASLSKAMSAICAWTLVEDGLLDWSDTVAQRLGRGPDITLAQLVTHTSGLVQDVTQTAMPLWLDRPAGDAGHNAAAVADMVLARGAPQGRAGRYHYTNENYALLTLMIEAGSGTPYAETCWPRVGLSDRFTISTRSAGFAPWGGIVATPAAYLEVITRWFGPGSAWAEDPFALPHGDMGGGAYYSLGMVFRAFGDGHNAWHFGAQCFPDRMEAGSYVVIWEGRAAAMATYDACLDWDAMIALDNALSRAAYGSVR